jgi:hypothetical protein
MRRAALWGLVTAVVTFIVGNIAFTLYERSYFTGGRVYRAWVRRTTRQTEPDLHRCDVCGGEYRLQVFAARCCDIISNTLDGGD